MKKKKNILITGLPAIGKTTLLVKLYLRFKEFNPAGFYTVEVKEAGERKGFEVVNLNGDSKLMAHTTAIKSKVAVGKYKIDLKGFEDFIAKIFSKEKKTGLYIVDEIAKMECESKKFSKLLVELLNSNKTVIATIAEKGTGLIADIKKRDDVEIHHIDENNRELKLKELTMKIRDLLLE
jgi:nucleoside-triphosphatase